MVIPLSNDAAHRPPNGDSQMRAISFIIAFTFVLASPSFSGAVTSDLPGIGTFSYGGSGVVPTEPAIRHARLTLTRRG